MKSRHLLVNEEIRLHGPHHEQAAGLYSLIDQQREYLGRWLTWVYSTQSKEDVRKFLVESHNMNMGGQRLITIISHKGQYCGNISYVKLDKTNHSGEIGYWLSETHQGQGIMTQSCKRIVRYGFEELGLHRIQIRVAVGNESSASIPKRLGFVEEGTARGAACLRGKYLDLRVFSMLKHEFEYS